MLQAPSPLSKVYGHSHIKKFWLMQTQKESENKALLASSSSSFCRHGASSAGKVHENKHSPQLTSGNPSARTLSAGASSPSALPVRPLVAGPGGSFCGASTRHASLVTCAESLSLPLCSDHSSILSRPSSPNISASNSKEESDLLAEVADCNPFKLPRQGSDLSASSSRCGSPRSHDLAGNAAYQHEPLKVSIPYHSNVYDRSSPCRDSPAVHQDDVFLQESFDRVKSSASTLSSGNHSLEPCNNDPGKASNSDSGNFDLSASPVQLPTKGLFEKPFEGKPFGKVSTEGKPFDKVWTTAEPLLSTVELGKVKSPEGCRAATKCESFEDAHPVRGSVLRTCSLCGTSKTPLWRSGPQGPKSLCNACGIRFKKSKRWSGPSDSSDQLASSLASPDSTKVSFRPPKRKQETLLSTTEAHWPRDVSPEAAVAGIASQQAKKSRWSMIMKGQLPRRTQEVTGSSGESCLTWTLHSPASVYPRPVKEFEKLAIGDKHRAVNRVDGKDDIEAAALLMYLSCGLVYA